VEYEDDRDAIDACKGLDGERGALQQQQQQQQQQLGLDSRLCQQQLQASAAQSRCSGATEQARL
jgi:hypothetical protein